MNHPYNQIVLFGDSITQMSFDPHLVGFGASLANAYQRKMDILNRGFSGYNTDWALPITHQILPTVEDQKKQAATIPLMTIFFGANDAALDFSPQHVPLNRFRDNLNTMIQLVKNPESKYYNPKMRLMLITPPPINEAQWQKRCEEQGDKLNRTNESARAYANVVKEIGAEKQLVVIDIWSRLMDLTGPGKRDLAEFLFDGLHLNGNGYEELYHLIMNAIGQHFPEIHPDKLEMEIPYWKDVIEFDDYSAKLQFPLLKTKPTGN